MEKILFGIVVYRELFWETVTFKNLITSICKNEENKNISIYIVDNTDIDGWKIEKPLDLEKFNIEYIKLPNPGISVAYNKIQKYAVERNIEWVVFLDQDTALPVEFCDVYGMATRNKDIKIKAPIVRIEKGILSPSKYINYRSYLFPSLDPGEIEIKGISCINTGLMVSTTFFSRVGGYDEHLKLDFCDHDFIERAKESTNKLEILNITLVQDFSSHTHTKKQALERYRRYIRDFSVFKKGRNKIKLLLYIDIPRLVKQTLKYKTFEFLRIRVNNV